MTATPTDEKGKSFKNIVYEYNLAQALDDGKYVKIPTVARRKNFSKGTMSDEELDVLKIEDAINIHERTKVHLELYAQTTFGADSEFKFRFSNDWETNLGSNSSIYIDINSKYTAYSYGANIKIKEGGTYNVYLSLFEADSPYFYIERAE